MTFKILIDDTHKMIYCYNIRNSEDTDTPNLCLDLFDGENSITQFNTSELDNNQYQKMMVMTPEDMIGCNFPGQPRYEGERYRETITKYISNHDKKLKSNPERIEYLYSFNNDQYEEIHAYNDIISHI